MGGRSARSVVHRALSTCTLLPVRQHKRNHTPNAFHRRMAQTPPPFSGGQEPSRHRQSPERGVGGVACLPVRRVRSSSFLVSGAACPFNCSSLQEKTNMAIGFRLQELQPLAGPCTLPHFSALPAARVDPHLVPPTASSQSTGQLCLRDFSAPAAPPSGLVSGVSAWELFALSRSSHALLSVAI
jgi:hypothetical protein